MSAQRRSSAVAWLLACGASLIAAFALTAAVGASPALAQSAWWHLMSGSRPTNLKEGPGQIVVTAANLGGADANGEGEPIRIVDTLPAGLTATSIEAVASGRVGVSLGTVACSLETLSCTFTHQLPSFAQIELRIGVAVGASAASGETNEARIAGGEAPSASIGRAITVGEQSSPAGVQSYELTNEQPGGAPEIQAGSHPDQTTLSLMLNQTAQALPVALPKDLRFNLPAGLIGDFRQGERCSLERFSADPEPECSGSVGRAIVTLNEAGPVGLETVSVPLYNLEPDHGEPARLGFMLPSHTPVLIDSAIRTGGDYGITLSVDNISEVDSLLAMQLTVGAAGASLWEMPTSCTSAQSSTAEADFWILPGSFLSRSSEPTSALDGCGRLPFDPLITVVPDGHEAATPTGMTFEVHLPRATTEAGISESDVKEATFILPRGVTLNPAGEEGLEECSPTQFALESAVQPMCPNASKLATLEVTTPLAPKPLMGALYAGAHSGDLFDSPIPLYLAVEEPTSGILVKVAGGLSRDPTTGQLVAAFANLPQLPFEELKLHLFGGEKAPLKTPPLCGTYTVAAAFVPWSGGLAAETPSTFDISSGRNGTTCKSAEEALRQEEALSEEQAFKEEEEAAERLLEEEVSAASRPGEIPTTGFIGALGDAGFKAGPSSTVPYARLASTALQASATGAVSVKVSCPAGESRCSGTVTLRTLAAVSVPAARAAKKKASVLTLATGSFTVAGGKVATVKLHLSAKARVLLARSRTLRARATLVAHDPAGATHTTQTVVTLRAAKLTHSKS
ncbi:MAG TPA: hypothetical protein VN892_17380 [Solirubrobacteraceae bacterium]|nr:hypothetical protein [Solirubrobacteraceae bacterium]